MSEGSKGEKNGMFGKEHPSKGIPQEIVECQYCNKQGGKSSMSRWHFDNCKLR